MKGLKPFLSTPILQGKTPPTYSFVAGETDLLKFYIYKNGLPSSKPFLLRRRHCFRVLVALPLFYPYLAIHLNKKIH